MMRERLFDTFKKSENIPLKDKRIIERALSSELKELNETLKEIKFAMNKLYADNNYIYSQIEKIHSNIQVITQIMY